MTGQRNRIKSFTQWATCALIAAAMTIAVGCASGRLGGCHCGACEGDMVYADGPGGRMDRMRRPWACGNGCGEIYYGDYINYPPDCCDSCDNAVQCTPPVVARPGVMLFRGLTGIYGRRLPRNVGCETCCEVGCDDCGCGCDGDCGTTEFYSTAEPIGGYDVYDDTPVVQPKPASNRRDCPSCRSASHRPDAEYHNRSASSASPRRLDAQTQSLMERRFQNSSSPRTIRR